MAEQLRRERLRREMIDEIIGAARLLLKKDGPSAIFGFALGLNGHRTGSRTLMRRLPRLSVPPVSVLGWATLCGLVLLELGCDREDLPEDIGKLYAAAGLHGLTGPRE